MSANVVEAVLQLTVLLAKMSSLVLVAGQRPLKTSPLVADVLDLLLGIHELLGRHHVAHLSLELVTLELDRFKLASHGLQLSPVHGDLVLEGVVSILLHLPCRLCVVVPERSSLPRSSRRRVVLTLGFVRTRRVCTLISSR